MKIISMEPTPSPYSIKININQSLEDGVAEDYNEKDDLTDAPEYVQQLFKIEGVQGLYRVIDFITIQRNPRIEWEDILPQVEEVIGVDNQVSDLFSKAVNDRDEESFGEVTVSVQMIRNIPTQVRLNQGEEEQRFALPDRIMNAAMEVASVSNNYLLERKWVEHGSRYGDLTEIGEQVVAEIEAIYSEKRLSKMLKQALNNETERAEIQHLKVTEEMLEQPNWRDRYVALAQMADPTEEDYQILDKALDDEHASVRRIATAYLGMIEEKETLPYLYKALQDRSVNVRRTAGDCLSDLGFKEAIPQMIEALSDDSRIVRWRAAMFLYEVGDETAVSYLQKALNDPEFEVRMQVKMALERIESGQAAAGSIWQQMADVTRRE